MMDMKKSNVSTYKRKSVGKIDDRSKKSQGKSKQNEGYQIGKKVDYLNNSGS